MGKSVGKYSKKYREEYGEKLKSLSKPITDIIDELPEPILLKMGKQVCSSDFEVRYYEDENTNWYHNREFLSSAIKRCWGNGAFDHREQILKIIEGSGYMKTD